MQLTAKTENDIITVYDSKNNIIGKLQINTKEKIYILLINDKTYKFIQEKWLTKVTENHQTIYHLRTNKFWGTIKIEELNKEIRGVFGFTWGTQLRDEYKHTLLKIRNDNQWINKGNYIIQLDKENINPLEILITLYGHIVGSIAKQKTIIYT